MGGCGISVAMGRRVIDKGFVDALTEAYAAHPGNASRAASAAGCDHRTSRRGWVIGWPKLGFRPIQEVIRERQEAARALVVQQESDQRLADKDAATSIAKTARLDMAKERAQEGQIARMARGNALATLGTAANLAKTGYKISQLLTEAELQGLPTKDRIRALKTIAEFNREAVSLAECAVKLERMIMGEPDVTVQHNHQHAHVVATTDDMAKTIERANAAFERSQARAAGNKPIIDV